MTSFAPGSYIYAGYSQLNFTVIATVMAESRNFTYENNFSSGAIWPGVLHKVVNTTFISGGFLIVFFAAGIPYDGIPFEEVVTLHVSVTVIFLLLASAGMVFTVVCLIFNFAFRNRRLIVNINT